MNKASGYGEVMLGQHEILFGLKKVGGQMIPLKFGTNTYRLLCEAKGLEFYQMEDYLKGNPFAMLELSYFAYVTAMRMRGEPTEIGIDTFVELAGDDADFIKEVGKIMEGARMWGRTVEEAKKKRTDQVE